jgi:hypothetical protein
MSKGQRRITFELEEVIHRDPRDPILFLGPFREDGLKLRRPAAWLVSKWLSFGQPSQPSTRSFWKRELRAARSSH